MSSAIWKRKSLILSYLTGGDIGSIDKMVRATCGQRGRHCYTSYSLLAHLSSSSPYFPPNGPQRRRGIECQYQGCRWRIFITIITIVVLAHYH